MCAAAVQRLHRQDFIRALEEVDTFLDISVEDLMDLNSRAEKYARIRSAENLRVETLMSQPVTTTRPDASLADAAHLLVTHKISGLPVVNHENKLVGLITEADFLSTLGVPTHGAGRGLWHTVESLFKPHTESVVEAEGCVADLMVVDVVTVPPRLALHEALDIMKKNRVKRVIVVDDRNTVVGVVTRSDLVRVFFDHDK